MERYYPFGYRHYLGWGGATEPLQFKEIPTCLVRKEHSCGKFLGASKSCFIACPSTEEIETILALITEKLTKLGIETVIAIKERAYGQDIFCTKICGKIIESQFCIVILDDTVEKLDGRSVNVPNPNVYYEYGLMTTLGKVIVPLQKEGHNLAFNIQTHDTVKYTPRNISSELDRALKDAIKATQEGSATKGYIGRYAQRIPYRSMEIAGYQRKGTQWFLSGEIEDTNFIAYGHPERREYVFFTVGTDKESVVSTLTDMQVLLKRLETSYSDLTTKLEGVDSSVEELEEQIKLMEAQPELTTIRIGESTHGFTNRSIMRDRLVKQIQSRDDLSGKLELIKNSKFAIVLMAEVKDLQSKVLEQWDAIDNQILKLPLYVGETSGIRIGDFSVQFRTPTL